MPPSKSDLALGGIVLHQLYVLADVLFTGGHPLAAVSATLFLAVIVGHPWFNARRERTRETHDADS